MPIYRYECPCCKTYKEVFQPMSESHECTPCDVCSGTALRIWDLPDAIVESGKTYFNHGLGVKVSNKHDVREAIKRINYDTGQSLVEVGNEKIKATPKVERYPTASELGY